jgi:A/G-specific adenine glycosylase
MPWKGESDPYKIWLSEIILQQTRVEQGLAYYEKFIKAFPTVHLLAEAPETEVFKMWEGLGYYSRCKNLIETARIVSRQYGGNFPSSYNEIIKLKGVGPYTAAAIASFAFNENRAVVDGNVQRVIARYFGISTPVDNPEGKRLFAELAQSLIDEDGPAVYNQAIMDFGATICKPRKPLCEQCIQSDHCEALKHGFINILPVKEKILKKRTRWLYYFIIETGDSVYIRKREDKDIWQNLHEFVLLETEAEHDDPAGDFLKKLLQHQSYSILFSSQIHSQQLTHQRINGRFFRIRLQKKAKLAGNYKLVKKGNLNEYAFPKFINTYIGKGMI